MQRGPCQGRFGRHAPESGPIMLTLSSSGLTNSEHAPKIRVAIHSAQLTVAQGSLRATPPAFSTPVVQP